MMEATILWNKIVGKCPRLHNRAPLTLNFQCSLSSLHPKTLEHRSNTSFVQVHITPPTSPLLLKHLSTSKATANILIAIEVKTVI